MTKDVYLDPASNDFSILNGELRLTENQQETSRQKTSIFLSGFKGECIWDTDFGIPYLSNNNNPLQLLGKISDKRFFDVIIKDSILAREGIIELLSYSSVVDPRERIISINFTAETEAGEIITVEEVELGI